MRLYAAHMPRPFHVLVIAVLVSACVQQPGDAPNPGGDGGSIEPAASTTTTLGRLGIEQATLEFEACIRAQGLDTPEIRLDAQGRPVLDDLRSGIDTSSVEFRRALTECASILTSVGALDLRRDPELQTVIVSQLAAFAECVRAQGVENFPDPDPAFSGVGSPFPSDEVPFTAPGFDAAIAICQEVLGATGFGE